jgi:energy-coupling factor transporter transmembrane protein EcfT
MQNLKFNQLNYLITPILLLAATALYSSYQGYLFCLLIAMINLLLLTREIHWKKLLLFCLCLSPAIGASYLTGHLFTASNDLEISQTNALNLSIRLFTIAMISFAFIIHMPKEKIMLELMQRKILPVTIGFGLLSTLNAFSHFADEFRRIQIAYQMRYQRSFYSPKIILPLLVASARYAQNVSISMFNRGLNKNRSYVHKIDKFGAIDYLLLLLNVGFLVVYRWH